MELRPLGRTGVQVSKLCLGTMMFGAWGNTDHDDSIRIIHARPRRRRQLRRHRRRLLRRRVRGDRRQGAQGPPRRRRAGDEVLHADGRGPQPPRRLAALDRPGGRGLAAAAGHRLDRPLPGPPPRSRTTDVDETLGALTDLVQQGKVRYIGSSSFSAGQIVEAQWTARERRLERFRTEQPPYSLLDARHRARRPAHRAAPRHGHPHLQPARRRLAVGQLDRRQLADLARPPAAGGALRHVAAREPAQARSRRAARRRSPTTPACR